MKCPHCQNEIKNFLIVKEAAKINGRKGGVKKSPKKTEACKKNGFQKKEVK